MPLTSSKDTLVAQIAANYKPHELNSYKDLLTIHRCRVLNCCWQGIVSLESKRCKIFTQKKVRANPSHFL